MKKTVGLLILVALLSMALCVNILALDVSGIYAANGSTGITMKAQTAAEEVVAPVDIDATYLGFCQGAERLQITYSAAETGKFYLLVVTNKETSAPQIGDIVYIDQMTATAAGVTFNAYPSNLVTGQYFVYLASNASSGYGSSGLTKVASFKYYLKAQPGDVDNDKEVTAADALCVLKMAVGKGEWEDWQKTAANVDGDTRITATDALWILEASVGNRVLE